MYVMHAHSRTHRAYHSAVVWDVCLDTFPMLFSEKSGIPRKSNCEQAENSEKSN
jgi:hypothetical protein